jgi:oligogalacturonide transport system substrate-binding protein
VQQQQAQQQLYLSTPRAQIEYDECTIRFDWWGGDTRHKATQAAVDAFMKKYPGIKVEVNFGAWTDWETARALEYQAGNGSDLTQINYSWINDYDADGSTFLDLNTESNVIDLTQYDSTLLKTCNDVKGQLAGIPLAVTGRTFYWNKTTFTKAGISTPTSLDELIAAGKTFKEKLGDDYYPLELGEYDRMLFVSFYLQAQTGEPIIDQNGKLTVTQDQLKHGLRLIKKLEDNHVIPTQATMAGDGNVTLNENPKFIDGHYAGVFEWDSAPAKYIKNLGEGQELVVGGELKGLGDKASGVSSKVSMLFAITKTSQHPHEAAMLLNYLVNDRRGCYNSRLRTWYSIFQGSL